METEIAPRTPLVGCAGWSVHRDVAAQFAASGSHLERYAARFRAVEINSSFYRPHRPETYRRWAESVPEDFRFAVRASCSRCASATPARWPASRATPAGSPRWSTACCAILRDLEIARVAADPAPVSGTEAPGGWPGLVYYRLHGSPRMYYSAYDEAYLAALAGQLARACASGAQVWCIFDNTADFAAAPNALALLQELGARG